MKKKKEKVVKEVEVTSSLTNPLLGIKFWLFCVAAALLLSVGIWLLLDRVFAASLAVAFTGIVIVIFGLVRIIPLVKSRKSGIAKAVTILEIVINVALGVFLVICFNQVKDETSLGNFVKTYYRYFLGFVFYAKAVFYFINSSLLKEETTKFEFWIHILVITIAVVVFATDFDATSLALLIAILSLLCAIFLIGMAGGSYYNYRKTLNKEPKKDKEKEDEDNDTKEEDLILPPTEDKQEETYIS